MPSSQSFPPPLQLAPSAESILVESLDPLAPYPCLPVTHPESHRSTLFPWVWRLQGSRVAEITHCLFTSLSVLLSWMQDSFPVQGSWHSFVWIWTFSWFVHILENICLFPHFPPRIRINTIISSSNIRHLIQYFSILWDYRAMYFDCIRHHASLQLLLGSSPPSSFTAHQALFKK